MKNIFACEHGFTLIEMTIVLAIVCITVPLSFLTLSHSSDEESMKYFSEELSDTISQAQMEAIAESSFVKIVFNTDQHFYTINKEGIVEKRPLDPRIRISTSAASQSLLISRTGSFSYPGTYHFYQGAIQYNLVLQIGQGRFYIEKISS